LDDGDVIFAWRNAEKARKVGFFTSLTQVLRPSDHLVVTGAGAARQNDVGFGRILRPGW
jgi:hypothetical protein